jgi:hypothetical protein
MRAWPGRGSTKAHRESDVEAVGGSSSGSSRGRNQVLEIPLLGEEQREGADVRVWLVSDHLAHRHAASDVVEHGERRVRFTAGSLRGLEARGAPQPK